MAKPKGQLTTVTKAATNSSSLRVTVPQFIVKTFGLEDGDKLLWQLKGGRDGLKVVVSPDKD